MATGPRGREPKRAALARLTVLSALQGREREEAIEHARLLGCRGGKVLAVQGAHADSVFGVVSGSLKVTLARSDGSEAILTLLGPGELVGELGLFQDGVRAARVTALEEGSVLALDKRVLLSLLQRSPAAALALAALIAARMRQLAQHFEEVTAMPVEQRMARKLLFLVERFGRPQDAGIGLGLKLSQAEIAQLADTTRQTANRWLAEWRRRGVVAVRGRGLYVSDVDYLRRIAGVEPTPTR